MGNVVLHLQIVEWKFNVVLDLAPHSVNELEAFQLKYQDLGQALKLELLVVLGKRLAPLDIFKQRFDYLAQRTPSFSDSSSRSENFLKQSPKLSVFSLSSTFSPMLR